MFGRRKPPEIKPSDWVEGTGAAEILLKPDIAPLPHRDRWQGLKNAGCLTEVWTVEKTSISDRRYFLTSLSDAAQILRGAKSIEGTGNRTHWTLGLRQKDGEEAPPRSEDQEQPGPAEANLEILKSYAARLIEADGEKKYFGQELTAVRKRLYAAWSTDYLLKVLQNL
jgi:hypothetical protein